MSAQETEFNKIRKQLKIYSYLITFSFMGIAALVLLGFFGWLDAQAYKALSIILGIMIVYLFILKIRLTKMVNSFVGNVDKKYGKNNDILKYSLDIIFKPDTNYHNFVSKVRSRKGR